MILPYYGGFPKITKSPVTWALVLVNVAMLIASYNFQLFSNHELEEFYKKEFVEIQGKLYAQVITDNPKMYSPLQISMAQKVLGGDRSSSVQLGQLAMADELFNRIGYNYSYKGDQVAVEYWKRNFSNFKNVKDQHPNFKYGISSSQHEWYNWISYMFIHAGISHLVGNMWFLLVVGAVVERLLGGIGFLAFYLVSGVSAALFYFMFSPMSAIPLVGASGAISSLVGFYSVVKWNRKVRFFTMFFMFRWKYLMVGLPAWVGFVYWLGLDFTGYFSQADYMGGVAHAAHLGGVTIGVLMGIFFRWRKALAHGIFRYHSRV